MKQIGPARSRALGPLGLALVLVLAAWTAAGQEFSELRLKQGETAYRARKYAQAIDDLRIAAFGLLDRPVLLSEALVYLALAQSAAGQRDAARVTLARFQEVERKFGAYSKAEIDAAARAEFDSRVRGVRGGPPPAVAALPPTPTPRAPRERVAAATPVEPRQSTDGETSERETSESAPRVLHSVRPTFPRTALREGAQGTVILRVLVSDRGEPLQVEILRGIRPDLSEAAVEAIKRWQFEPARKDGKPVQAWTTVAIPFQR